MSDSTTDQPPANWYPDPRGGAQRRWWDGTAWTEKFESFAPPVQPESVAQEGSSPRVNRNRWALPGFLVAVLSLVFGVAVIFNLIAIIFSILGIVRASALTKIGQPAKGRALSILGLVFASISLIYTVAFVLPQLFTVASAPAYEKADTESSIQTGASDQGLEFDNVDCPDSPSFKEDSTFNCVATDADGNNTIVVVEVQDNDGNYTWRTTP